MVRKTTAPLRWVLLGTSSATPPGCHERHLKGQHSVQLASITFTFTRCGLPGPGQLLESLEAKSNQ
eukprot:2667311-Amphidinium_carterae.1